MEDEIRQNDLMNGAASCLVLAVRAEALKVHSKRIERIKKTIHISMLIR